MFLERRIYIVFSVFVGSRSRSSTIRQNFKSPLQLSKVTSGSSNSLPFWISRSDFRWVGSSTILVDSTRIECIEHGWRIVWRLVVLSQAFACDLTFQSLKLLNGIYDVTAQPKTKFTLVRKEENAKGKTWLSLLSLPRKGRFRLPLMS